MSTFNSIGGGNLNLFDELKNTLLKNSKYSEQNTENPKLLRNVVIEDALNMNKELLHILLRNPKLKNHFFTDVDGVLVFDKNKFTWTIENKEFLPDSYTRFKQKIGLIDSNDRFISSNNDVVLSFPYKDCVLEGGQTKDDQKRSEIFFNETLAPEDVDCLLAPKVFTNIKKYTKDGEETVSSISSSDNLLIKGNNLLALSSLQKRYQNKVKLIYIDPPYNTGNDSFGYNDTFNHSTWLVFMKNRLEISKRLLREDGVICIQCDDNEQAYLKVLCDEIFGRENLIASISVKSNSISGNKTQHKEKTILKNKDTIHCYKKENIIINPQYVKKDKWDTHYNSFLIKEQNEYKKLKLSDRLVELGILKKGEKITEDSWKNKNFRKFALENKEFIFRTVNSIPNELKTISLNKPEKIIKYTTKEGNELLALNGKRLSTLDKTIRVIDGELCLVQLLGDLWTDIDFQNTQNQGGVSFTNAKKPEQLIARIIKLFTNENDIVLDYFSGSGTTGAVALKLKRHFICCEQMDYINSITYSRLVNTINGEKGGISQSTKWNGGGSVVFFELKDLNQYYIDKVNNAELDVQLVELFNIVSHSKFISTKITPKTLDSSVEIFEQLSFEDKRKLLIQLLDLNMLYVNYSDIDDDEYDISDIDKQFNRSFYGD